MNQKVVVIGGAGFIGFHCTVRALSEGHSVTVLDNLSRAGALANVEAIRLRAESLGRPVEIRRVDIRNAVEVEEALAKARPDLVIHQAAQVAVTSSVSNPRHDFEVNALGTFNVLEAIRARCPEAFLIYSSTNKVYGGMEDVVTVEEATRYRYRDYPEGLDESRSLDLHSPYGCSKGSADQYVHDYHRIYGLRTAVFRQSCIYGSHQFGIEDQGWVAWFTIAAVLRRDLTIYGSGKQVRDLLWIDDLTEAYWQVWRRNKAGSVFNMGGGSEHALSLLELLQFLSELGVPVSPKFASTRPGDQPVYIANSTKARTELAWRPTVSPREGVERLLDWVRENHALIQRTLNFS